MPTKTGRHLIWIAAASWDGLAGTDRHMATAMAQHVPILWVDPPVSPATAKNRRGSGRIFRPELSVLDDRITRLRPVALPGLTRPGIRTLTPMLVRQQIRWAIRKLGIRPFAVVATYLDDLLGRWGPDTISVLYGTDDYVAGAELMGLSARYQQRREFRSLAQADLVAVVSLELARRWTDLGFSPMVIPNGCGIATNSAYPPPSTPIDLPRPVVGLIGQLSERIDLDILRTITDAGFSLLLVGPVDPRWKPDRFNELASKPNVRYVGAVPLEMVPSYLAAIDVGITPYRDTPFNRASFPLKTLEYLGAGLPVVTTDLPAARWLHDDLMRHEDEAIADRIFLLARDGTEYVDAIRRIVTDDSSPGSPIGQTRQRRDHYASGRCREFAARHTWSRRADDLASFIGCKG
jgi:teichuronic acid biosynthesis glycosyltransferase TuaH